MSREVLIRAAALGTASGGRSTAGVAAVSLRGSGSVLSSRIGKRLTGVALVGELVADKLPLTPSRLMAPSLGLRSCAGAVSSGLNASRRGESAGAPAAIGAVTALAGSLVGARWRARAVRRGKPDLPSALIEDVVTLALAAWAVR